MKQPVRDLAALARAANRTPLLESKIKSGTQIIYKGVVETKASGGRLLCKVIYNSQDDSYTGELINDRFSPAEWHSRTLGNDEAKQYFLTMHEQDPDHKRRLD